MIVMPIMNAAQESAWHSLLELYEAQPAGWTLIGGQLVHLHCAERLAEPPRATNDADAVVNARIPEVLIQVTTELSGMGFIPQPSADGIQHRWVRGDALIDILIPEGTGERTELRHSASGFPTVAAPGGSQALERTEVVSVRVGDRTGAIPRPTLLSAMILKAAAYLETTGPGRDRHCLDFLALAAMLAASDLLEFQFTQKDLQRLRKMVNACQSKPHIFAGLADAQQRLERLLKSIGAQ